MASDHPWVVEFDRVTVTFGPTVALEGVSLRVARGEFVGVVGPNGSGKTTLLRTILGLVRPVEGQVRAFGTPVEALGSLRHRIGYVPQMAAVDTRFPVRVLDVVMMGRYGVIGLVRRPGPADRAAAQLALERVGLQDMADRHIGQLSGGQRQRVLIARALAVEPELLLLDEPTTGVDPAATGSLYELLNRLHHDRITIIMVSHDVAVVSQYVDQVACLNRRLVVHGRPDQVLTAEAFEGCYGCGAMYFSHGVLPHLVVEPHQDRSERSGPACPLRR